LSLFSNTTASDNTAVGMESLCSNTTGHCNTAVGLCALVSNTTGMQNVAMGRCALTSMTTGQNNIGIGNVAGSWGGGSRLETGSQNIHIGYATASSGTGNSNELVIGANGSGSVGKGSNTGFINSNAMYQGSNSASWNTTSDRRIKKNIVDNTIGLDKINQIQVRNFEYRTPEEITELPKHSAIYKQGIQVGVIAQEIEQILPDVVKEESTGVKTVNPDNITWYLVNAIKELKARIEVLENE